VVGDPAGDHLVAVPEALELLVLLDQLDDRLVGLRAARDEEHAVQVARRDARHLRRELDRARMGVVPVGVERQLGHLLGRRLAQLRPEAVADLRAEEARERVEVLLAVRVIDRAMLAAGDHRHLARLEGRVAGEVHQEVAFGERLKLGVVGHAGRSFQAWQPLDRTASGRFRPPVEGGLYTRRAGLRPRGYRPMAVHTESSSEALRTKRDRYVARGVSIAPIFAARAHGARLTDADGREYIDFAGGIGVLNLGHTPDAVVEAIQQQAAELIHACFPVAAYEPYLEVCRMLSELAPGSHEKKAVLVNSGAEAVENAVKIARYHTGRPAVITFDRGFHGRTLLAMSLTSKLVYKRGMGPFAPEVYRA